nr:MAG TPA: portal protein [Caudoviricetes sp.]
MSLKDFFTRRRLNRLQRDLNMLRDTIKFNPYAVAMIDSETDKDFSRRITEYRVWSMGNSYVLRRFFVGTLEYRTCNYFWTRAPLSYRMIHSGLPGLICSKMPRILFGNGIAPTVSVYKDSGEVDKNKTKAATDYTLQLIDKVKLRDVLTECATNESWGGHSFIKFSFDTDLSNFPIIEAADIMSTEVVKERNETVAIIFKTWYEDKKTGNQQRKYRLDEIYTTDATGDAVIRYELYELTTGEEKRVPLNSIPETQKIVEAVNGDDEVVFTGLKGMLAFEKPNKLPSLEFPHSNYGASDFEGATDSFDAVDEAYSTIINEIRDNRTFRYFASHNFRRDKDTGEILTPDDGFTKNFVLTEGDIDQEQGVNKNRIVDQIPDKTEEHKAKYLTAVTVALNKAGLSPYSIGITGLESINQSAESQQERNKVTLETRKAKLELWTPYLSNVLSQLLAFNTYLLNTVGVKQDDMPLPDMDITLSTVTIDFGEYLQDTDKDLVDIWGLAKSQGISSTQNAVRELHKSWSEKQILDETNVILFENGMATDTPNGLPDLTGIETDERDDTDETDEKDNKDDKKETDDKQGGDTT